MFGKKKKEEAHKGDIFLAEGIYLKKPAMQNGNVVINCFLRSLIVFLLVFGSIGGFLSAFEISYNIGMVIVFYLLLSTFFSFLYATSKMVYRDVGYILFFGVFVCAIYVLRIYANSGFYTIINAVLQRAQAFFNLSGVREYEVQINNNYLTVAIVAIFIGMVIMIVLNIWIYATMSLAWTVLFTFPVLFIPLYMELTPGPIYLIALCMGYTAVLVFKGNGHYLVFAWDTPFRVRGFRKDRISYTQDSRIFRQVLSSFGALFFAMVILVEFLFPSSKFQSIFKEDKLHDKTQEAIGNFVLLGFEGIYNHYSSTGGMSGGKLGGVSNVRPDYQTDLVVTFTPYSPEGVYLKGYTGGRYGDNQWESLYDTESTTSPMNMDDVSIFQEESLEQEALELQSEMLDTDGYGAYGVMDVRNVGADVKYLYYPYYTLFEDYNIYKNHSLLSTAQGLGMQQVNTYSYYPKVVWNKALAQKLPKDIDTSGINEVFLEVPEKNQEVIAKECEKIGLTAEMTENEITEMVIDYFQDNIPYTLKPGATPKGEDFINYFLTKNRKGYCAHFASAATLIFRQMGIPARYVEGYAISYEAALASDLNEEKRYSDYYWGYSAIGESAVLDVEVTDAMAHAWVEIYVEGFGWKVVDVTPSSSGEEETDDFWSAFTALLSGSGVDGDEGTDTNINIDLMEYFWLVYVIIGIIALIVLVHLLRLIVRKLKRYGLCHQKNEGEAVISCYADLCDMLRTCDSSFDYCKSHREQLAYMQEKYQVIMEVDRICEEIEKLSFSKEAVDGEILTELRMLFGEVRKAIWRLAKLKERVRLAKR